MVTYSSLALAGIIGITAGMVYLEKEIENTDRINKEYNHTLHLSREAGLEFEKVLGLTDEQLRSGSVSAGVMRLALDGLRDSVEEDNNKIKEYKDQLQSLNALKVSNKLQSWTPFAPKMVTDYIGA